MLNAHFGIRFVTILIAIAALLDALLMFLAGTSKTIAAYQVFVGFTETQLVGVSTVEATIKLLAAQDNFLFGRVLLYFTYSVYFLFIKREAEAELGDRIKMLDWLKVQSLA